MNEVVSTVDGINESAMFSESVKHEPTNQWDDDSVNQWLSESVSQWINEPIIKWVNQWTNEPMNQYQSMNQWIKESMNQRTNEFLCWATSSLSDLFAEAPSLSYFFSKQPLIWATSALSCLPASSCVASATQCFSAAVKQCVSTPPAATPLQSWGASQDDSCFAAGSRANALCPSRLQARKTGAPHQINQRAHSVNSEFRAAPSTPGFLVFIWNQSLATDSLVHVLHHPKVLRSHHVCAILNANRALTTVLCTFCRQLPQIEARNCGNRDLTSATLKPHCP